MTNPISLLALITLFACSGTKRITEKNTAISATQNSTTTDTNYRFTVSFISIGTGTDYQAKKKYNEYIKKFEQKNKVMLSYETIDWGREGEVDYCFNFKELDKKKKELFIAETKEILRNTKLVLIRENSTCKENKK